MHPTDNTHRRASREIAESVIGALSAVSSPAVSPDGRRIAAVVSRVDLPANTTRTAIWIADADAGAPARPLTAGDPNDAQPTWAPDGRSLAFTSKRAPRPGDKPAPASLHVMPMDGPGEVRTVCTAPEAIEDIAWSPDGRWIAFTSRTPDERYSAPDESWQAPRRIDRFFSRLDGEGWIIDRPRHVYVVPADGSTAPRNLTPGPFQHAGVSWLADSSGIVTSAARHDEWDLDLAQDLYLVRLDGTIDRLTEGPIALTHPSVSPDGSRVAFLGLDDPLTQPQNLRVGVLDLATRDRRWVSSELDRTFETTSGTVTPVWRDVDTILGSAEDRGTCHVYAVAADGSVPPRALTSGRRWVRGWDARGGTLALCVAEVDRPAELFVRPLDGGDEKRLTAVTGRLVESTSPRTWQHVLVPTADGTLELDAWVMPPADLTAGQTYPVLLNVHGGPHTQYGETFFDEAQMQAAAGFVVVMCNPRGSSGREQSFGQAILGPKHSVAPGTGWGGADVDDVMAVLDHVLHAFPFCDRSRVGMLGGSYGGYMATELAGRFGDRFRGICSERSVNNMLSEEWSSDIATVFRVEHGPDHVSDPDEYTRLSPIRHVRDIHVPMLILHSEDDLRCPISQAEELFVALRTLRREVDFYRFPAECHELSRSGSPVHRVQRAEIILDWFTEKLAPQTA